MSKKVLTIRAGETKILPKGAKIISTGTTGIVATSNCPDVQSQLANAESYKCYTINVSSATGKENDTLPTKRIYFTGVLVGGKAYAFSNSISFKGDEDHITSSYNALGQALKDVYSEILAIDDLRGLFINGCTSAGAIGSNEDNGIFAYLSFRSLPSIADNGGIGILAKYAGLESNVNIYSYVSYIAQPIENYSSAVQTPCACTGSL